jgi:hypothetical protein
VSETYVKAEIVRPKRPMPEQIGAIIGGLIWLAFSVLIVWWFFAAWHPQLGLSYWQLVLPVYAFRILTGRAPFGRQLK